ncbi:unnamed protein product [Schistocephalus solidus]|uniref:N-acetylglucosaminyl-phosphatidylinositol biosynthetic protein gpi1 n=1 Tax=Schistocephalus solidus TaxID=70667 RepID=A0A183T3J2_SCHSO|nr:unnamed protein product [Schistocephalus solidus]
MKHAESAWLQPWTVFVATRDPEKLGFCHHSAWPRVGDPADHALHLWGGLLSVSDKEVTTVVNNCRTIVVLGFSPYEPSTGTACTGVPTSLLPPELPSISAQSSPPSSTLPVICLMPGCKYSPIDQSQAVQISLLSWAVHLLCRNSFTLTVLERHFDYFSSRTGSKLLPSVSSVLSFYSIFLLLMTFIFNFIPNPSDASATRQCQLYLLSSRELVRLSDIEASNFFKATTPEGGRFCSFNAFFASELTRLLIWLGSAEPAGLKINRHLSKLMSRFFLSHVAAWKVYVDSLIGVFVLGANHIYDVAHHLSVACSSASLLAVASSWRLCRSSSKWNPLRNRVDTIRENDELPPVVAGAVLVQGDTPSETSSLSQPPDLYLDSPSRHLDRVFVATFLGVAIGLCLLPTTFAFYATFSLLVEDGLSSILQRETVFDTSNLFDPSLSVYDVVHRLVFAKLLYQLD